MGHEGTQTPTSSRLDRYERSMNRSDKKKHHTAARFLIDFYNQASDFNQEHAASQAIDAELCFEGGRSISCQTDISGTQITEAEVNTVRLNLEVQHLRSEVHELRKRVSDFSLSPESFENNEEKVKFYTGLPNFLTLMAVFSLIEDHITESGHSLLTKFQQMMLCLMKLRLNLPHLDLA